MADSSVDVVIVGAGIAGSALARTLALAGKAVLVLERSEEYVDRIRGEFLQPWGVAEAQQLGVYDVLIAAGGNSLKRVVGYDEAFTPEEVEAGAVAIDALMPGVPGALGIGHPVACRALEAAAVAAGADVRHGVEDVVVSPGSVTFSGGGGPPQTVSCGLVVGADGRESTVRRQLGIELSRNEARVMLGGLLVDGMKEWPDEQFSIGTHGDRLLFIFPQGGGRARFYMGRTLAEKDRFGGADKAEAFIAAFEAPRIRDSERLTAAVPAGPCAAFAMHDTWCDEPVGEHTVLIGDAAGYSDPIIGEGLSIALRDARMVGEAVIAGEPFDAYVEERAERMRRLRFCAEVFTDLYIPRDQDQLPERRRNLEMFFGGDPDLFMLLAAINCGPELAPPTAFDPSVRERVA